MSIKPLPAIVARLLACLFLIQAGFVASTHAQRRYTVAHGLPNNQTRQIIALPDGRLLAQTDAALSVFDGAVFRPLELDRRLRQPIENFFSIDHYLDSEGRLWVKGMSDLYVLDTPSLTTLDARSLLCGVKAGARNVFVTDDGVVWVHGGDDRLYRCLQGDTTAMLAIDSRNTEGINAVVCDVVQVGQRPVVLLSDGRLCIPGQQTLQVIEPLWGYRLTGAALDDSHIALRTNDGIVVYNLDTGQPVANTVTGAVFHLATLSPGKVMATTNDAVWIVTTEQAVRYKSVHNLSQLQGATFDQYNGLWLCTWGDGLLYYSPYQPIGHWATPTADPLLNAINRDSHGREWRSYHDARIETDNCAYTHDDIPDLWGNVPFCIEAQDGVFLTCTRMNRLALFRPPHIEFLFNAFPQLLHYRNVVDGCRVGDRIVVASQNGMYAFNCRTLTPEPEYFAAWNENQWSDKVNCLLPQADSIVWVGTSCGLFRLKGQEYQRVSGENVQSLVFDANGRLWFSTIDGRIVQGDRTVAKTDATFRERKARLMPDGSLEFLTTGSAFVFHPDSVHLPQLILTPHLMSTRPNTTATYDASALDVDVSALAYGLEEQVVYRYRLDGAEEDWHMADRTDGRLHIAYNVVPPGEYVLQIQTALQGQPWGEILEIPYCVTPPWWRTWWAITLYIICILAIATGIIGQFLHRKQERLKQQMREESLLKQIEALMQAAQDSVEAETSKVTAANPSDKDREFVQRAIELVNNHLSDNYTVEQMATDLCMERTGLYKRLTALVNQSPQLFIRSIRLNHAVEMMKNGKSITDTAYATGFNSVSYFGRCFAKEFGCSPSEYLNSKQA